MKGKTILITGGAGFIGSHLTEDLLKQKCRIVAVDDFNDYYDPQQKRSNVKRFLSRKDYTLVTGDIRNSNLLEGVFKQYAIDGVVHLAARAGVRPSLTNPQLYWDVNVMGTLNLLEAMENNAVRRLVFASSSSVYGDRDRGPFRETDRTDRPISPYGASKKAGEVLCATYADLYQIKTSVLRFFTVFGPGNRPDMAMYKLTRAIMENREFTMFGDGSSGRDYTYITDITAGIGKAMDPAWQYEIFNLGNSQPVTLKQLIGRFETVTKRRLNLVRQDPEPGDVIFTYADIAKAGKMLGWQPEVSLDSGIKQLIDWYVKQGK